MTQNKGDFRDLTTRPSDIESNPDGTSLIAANNEQKSPLLDLRSVTDGMSEGFALLAPDFTILDMNAEALRLDQRSREDLIGQSHWQAFPGTEDSELGKLYKKAMAEQVPVSLEHRYLWADGRVTWLGMRAYPVADGRLAIFFRDVTERYEAERALRQSEQRLRAAVEAFADALWTNDAQGQMTDEQPGWAALTGQSRDEYEGYGWSNAVHPDDAQPTLDAWEMAVTNKRPFVFEHRVKTRDGAWRRFAIRAVPVFEDDGTIREWVGVHRDITETTEARLQLARSAETFETLVRNSPFGLYVVDGSFRMLHISDGSLKAFAGIDPLIGRDFAEILHEQWDEPFASETTAHFRHTLATGEPHISRGMVEERRNIDATEAYDWRIERVDLPDGTFGVVCYFYDLSERVELETSLKRALDDKDMLLREIDHRVRNSLSLVASMLLMQGGSARSAEVKQALKIASARMQAVARIHERLYKGTTLGIVQFEEYLAEICDDLQASLGSEGVQVRFNTVPLQLAVDHAIPLGLVTNELVTNAFKHCNGDNVVITVKLASEPGGYSLTVADDGAGMPADFVTGKGNGLGMQVVKLLTGQIGGKIEMPSPGEVAHFKIFIPQSIVAEPPTD